MCGRVTTSKESKLLNQFSVALCVPTKNPGPSVWRLVEGIKKQSIKPGTVLILDSCSLDGYIQPFREIGAKIYLIPDGKFDHGGTRRLGADLLKGVDVVIWLTQDAIPCDPEAFESIVKEFEDPSVGLVYGRQLPRTNANPFEAHARLFNYPPVRVVKTIQDVPLLGIKAAFCSNSFAAYRQSALSDIGGFPESCIVSEDTYVAAKMLKKGWKIAYCPAAKVYHSHAYRVLDEFRRYFDIGVFHSREPWVMECFGRAEGEGLKFVISEIKYTFPRFWWLLPSMILRTLVKYLGFMIGKNESILPAWIKLRLTMHPNFFSKK